MGRPFFVVSRKNRNGFEKNSGLGLKDGVWVSLTLLKAG